jgi:hypothetical protein
MNDQMKSNNLFLPAEYPLRTRNLETAFVNHSKSTGLWITTISNTDHRESKRGNRNTLKAFSFRSEEEAKETAYVNAPPKMIPFHMASHCFTCDSKFSVFRRASHCRNCGVCICNSCSTTWNRPMLPETYNAKNSRVVKVCTSCDYISSLFRQALLNGDYDMGKKLYMTGNINLRCPFTNIRKKNEVMLPIHCAAYGGNLRLLTWLVDIHYCPLQMIHTGNRGNQSQKITPSLIKTSRGRTVADIAMDSQNFDILKYLVNEKNISLTQGDDKQHSSFAALEMLLKSKAVCQSPSQEQTCTTPRTTEFPRTLMSDSPNRKEKRTQRRLSSPRTPRFNRNVVKVIPDSTLVGAYPRTPKFNRTVTQVKRSEMFSPRNEKKFNFDHCAIKQKKPPILPARIRALSRIKLSSTLSTAGDSIGPSVESRDDSSKDEITYQVSKSKQVPPFSSKRHGNTQSEIPSYTISRFSHESDDDSDSDLDNDQIYTSFDDDESVATTVDDNCIICCDNAIDCVFSRCGHQVCCLECSDKMSKCPICNSECEAIRIFKP